MTTVCGECRLSIRKVGSLIRRKTWSSVGTYVGTWSSVGGRGCLWGTRVGTFPISGSTLSQISNFGS